MSTSRPSTPRPRHSLPLERKLPLLIAAMLLIVLVVVLGVTYHEILHSSRTAAVERLQRVSHELAASAAHSVSSHLALMTDTIGTDSVIRRVLAGGIADSALVESKLRRLRSGADTTTVVELWSADRREVWKRGSGMISNGPPEAAAPRAPLTGDSAHFSPLYAEHGGVYYWIVAPIMRDSHRLGWITERRRINSSPDAQARIHGLIGEGVDVYFKNDTGSFWTTIGGTQVAAPLAEDPTSGFATQVHPDRQDAERRFVAESRIDGTPWAVVLDVPVSVVDTAPLASITRLVVFTLVLLVAAVVVAWVISRRLTRPLIELTDATDWIARGDYSRRVDVVSAHASEEIGRLAESFNRMVSEVEAAHAELEQQMEEAQSMSEELESANAQLQETTLEAEFARDEAEVARREAEEANRAKSAFLATMSHELRTPLNAIAGYAELLEMGVRGPVTPEQREDLERIRRSQRALLALVDDVLSFARIEAGRLEFRVEEVPLDATLTGVENHIAPQARAKGISYEYRAAGADVHIWTDREKLERIVINLLSNAVKFTTSGGHVILESVPREERVEIRVIDTGCGIAPNKLEAIFEPFTQAEAGLTRRSEGTGLGLAISREFAHAMGGELLVESVVNKGSTFTLRLPIRSPSIGGVRGPSLGDGALTDELRTQHE
ncbi:MAG TPA: ATP-binding protein [Gemmatimonadaceae bacterium]